MENMCNKVSLYIDAALTGDFPDFSFKRDVQLFWFTSLQYRNYWDSQHLCIYVYCLGHSLYNIIVYRIKTTSLC